ncbi:hypothetical protein SLS56_004182 [Neofusicoccum ribis]|uniref:Zn(2)-C6 fungal-type domain-containing protein n=1 Tax=Neofusicoccum ribis TaxID=45134 RepID=A0ABR3SX98_9PEZI
MPRSSSESVVRDAGIRKKMRKGTHSCFECRRRKIRCIFSDEHPGECTECFARGSRCIDQEHADPESIVDNRKNLRERVAKLEALIESLLDDRSATGAAEALRKLGADVLPPTPRSDASSGANQTSAPVMAMFDNEVLSRGENLQPSVAPAQAPAPPVPHAPTAQVYDFPGLQLTCECDDIGIPKVKKSKEKRTRDTLLTLLPPKDVLEKAITTNDDWWRVWRHRLGGTARGKNLQQFAAATLEKGNPAELGVLLLCIGVAMDLDSLNNTLALVDALIISDDEYAATIEGMECALLVSKCYSEIGQPRRAWLASRKGLTYAQLMVWDSVWWSLYQTDRFLSLLLGLPYGISDAHCDLNYYNKESDTDDQRDFMLKLSVLAGKVIDRTQGVHELSLAAALELDQELDTIVESMPAGWWNTQTEIMGTIDPVQLIQLRERLLAQICFQQLRVYLHLPFMLKSTSMANSSKYAYSRSTCFGASRELIVLYHFLRSGNGEPLYECKVIDFLGFTAAVLIMLGLLGYARVNDGSPGAYHNAIQEEQDWRLIEITMDIFGRASTEKGGKVASQSLKVLQQLSSVRNINRDLVGEHEDKVAQRIVIPYFGTISVRRGKKFNHVANKKSNSAPRSSETSNASSSTGIPNAVADSHGMSPPANTQKQPFPSPTLTTNQHSSASSINGDANGANNSYVAYDPFVFPGSFDAHVWPGEEGLDNLMGGSHGGPWHNLATSMDIDQDWTWFMGGTQAETVPGVQVPGPPMGPS